MYWGTNIYDQWQQGTAAALPDRIVDPAVTNHTLSIKYKTHRYVATLSRICGKNFYKRIFVYVITNYVDKSIMVINLAR